MLTCIKCDSPFSGEVHNYEGFPGGTSCKEPAHNAGDLDLIPQLGSSPGGGHDNPLQCSCLENPHE